MENMTYTTDNILEAVYAGVSAIPKNTKMRDILDKVINCYKWGMSFEDCWQEITDEYLHQDKCAEFHKFDGNIDAKLNAAYVLIGLLYGNGDFTDSMEIAMRCGQDSDCNPSSAGSVVGKTVGVVTH